MKNSFIALVVFLLITLSSCTNDGDDNIVNVYDGNNSTLLKNIIIRNKNTNAIFKRINFVYSGNKIIKSVEQNGNTCFYEYIGDLISNIKIFNSNNELIVEYNFSYLNSNLSQTIYKEFQNNYSEKRNYSFNGNLINFQYLKGDLLDQNTLLKTGTILIQNDEIKERNITYNLQNSSQQHITYEYDDKNNPYKNVIGIGKLMIELDRFGGIYKNLISTMSVYNNSVYNSTNYTYEYNSNNYPIKSTDDSNNLLSSFKYEYYYY